MWVYTYNDELYHYGVKGMKWGVRKAKQDYKDAKRAQKEAFKNMRRSGYGTFSLNKLDNYRDSEKAYERAKMDTLHAKAKYKASKKSNAAKAEKAEIRTYAKEMKKTGMIGSEANTASGRKSDKLYDELVTKKGKEFADKVHKKVRNQLVTEIATGAAVGIGLSVVSAMLQNRYGG